MKFLLWHSGLRILPQWLGSLWRREFNPWPGAVGYKGSATAQIQCLAWELPYTAGTTTKYIYINIMMTFYLIYNILAILKKTC